MTRVMLVIQLCFAFMVLVWYACFPFMGELYHFRSRLFLAQTVRGDEALLAYVPEGEKEAAEKKLRQNRAWLQNLPGYEQDAVHDDIRHYQEKLKTPFSSKVYASFEIVTWRLPLFKRAWMFFALIISLAVLYRFEGAVATVWILPFLSLCFLLNHHFLEKWQQEPDAFLFPTLENGNFSAAWDHHLSEKWSRSGDRDEGEFYFNLARLKAMRNSPSYHSAYQFHGREKLGVLILYFVWNLLFAYTIFKKEGTYVGKTQQYLMDRSYHSV